MKRFKRHKDYGFFDQDLRLSKLSQLGDPSHANPPQRESLRERILRRSKGLLWRMPLALEKLKEGIDFEQFGLLLQE